MAQCNETNYDASGSSSLSSDPTVTAHPRHPLAALLSVEEEPLSLLHPHGRAVPERAGPREQAAFSSILTFLAVTGRHPLSLVQTRASPAVTRDNNHTSYRPSDAPTQGSEMSSSSSLVEPKKNLSSSPDNSARSATAVPKLTATRRVPTSHERTPRAGDLVAAEGLSSDIAPVPNVNNDQAATQITSVSFQPRRYSSYHPPPQTATESAADVRLSSPSGTVAPSPTRSGTGSGGDSGRTRRIQRPSASDARTARAADTNTPRLTPERSAVDGAVSIPSAERPAIAADPTVAQLIPAAPLAAHSPSSPGGEARSSDVPPSDPEPLSLRHAPSTSVPGRTNPHVFIHSFSLCIYDTTFAPVFLIPLLTTLVVTFVTFIVLFIGNNSISNAPVVTVVDCAHTHWPPSPTLFPSATTSVQAMNEPPIVVTETATQDLTSREMGMDLSKDNETSLNASQTVNITSSIKPTKRTTAHVPPSTHGEDTATAPLKPTTVTPTFVALSTATTLPTSTTTATTTTTTQPTTTTPQPTTNPTKRTTTHTTATTTTAPTTRGAFTPPAPKTSPPRGATTIFLSPFTTTTTEAPPQQCNITERMWVKTVVSIYVRRNRLDSIQRQNLRRGLTQALRRALNDTTAQAQVETVFGSPNMTVGYHVIGADIVYPPSVVVEALSSYGRDRLIADLRQFLPMVTALPNPAAAWRPSPATGLQLKTVLRFVGAGDDPRSCRFSQMMEQRMENVFSEAQAKVLNAHSRLTVQMLSVSQLGGSPAVSLVYTVRNRTAVLNGTMAANLLNQLTAELVGYFLFYPPLIIAEPLEYHNLNTSIATRDFWVITVIQDVDNSTLEAQYQSFACLMEQRLAELFVEAGQQGTRFRRAATVDSYTVQMVSIRRVAGAKNPGEMTYYVQQNGVPLPGTSAAKLLNTVDSQTMALTLGYFVQLQAEPVVKNPPNNLWIIAAVLAPFAVVTLIIIIITAVLCRKNKSDFKADAIGNLNPRAKTVYRRDVGYFHQPVQGFDYAKQHLGRQGGEEETLPGTQDTLVLPLSIRDAPLSLEKALHRDGTANKKNLTVDLRKRLPSEDGSVISNESEKLNLGRGSTVQKVTAQQKLTKEETRKRNDPYDTSSGSLQLISVKPMAAQPTYSHPASSDRSQDSAILNGNGEVNLALKQKSDIEHYRNKLRLKAKRKGYYDFPSAEGSGSTSRALAQRQRPGHGPPGEQGPALEPDDDRGSTFVKSRKRHSQGRQQSYRSRQSLNSPSPGGTEMDLLVMRERPRRGIRNSGYDTEPELIEETDVDRLTGPRGYLYGRGVKGHSETSTLSSQPSIDEVRQQMHLLLEEAFSLASGGHSTSGRHHHHHHHHQPPQGHYSPGPPPLPYADVVTSAPGTMSRSRGGLQWVPAYGADVYQCSMPKPAFRFTQLPDMAVGSPPPPLPPRSGPSPGTSLRRSSSDLVPKGRTTETSVTDMQTQHNSTPYVQPPRAALPAVTTEQSLSNYSGNPITAVYAIPATRPGYSEYFVSTPPSSYHSPSWMSYPPEPEDVPPQWADSVALPGYVEAFPHPRYPKGSSTRLPLLYSQGPERPPSPSTAASQRSLPEAGEPMDNMPLSSLSTSALVQAIRQEVAKLAKKQNDMFEFQV
ncbi:UPF0606 protein KIAA1549L [Aplochiton taeniatus]